MNAPVELLIFEKSGGSPQLVATVPLLERTELGRQETTAETLYSSIRRDDGWYRIVIARGTEQTIGRHHTLIERLADGRVRLTNTSTRSTIQVDNGPSLTRDEPQTLEIPPGGLVLRLGSSRVVRLQYRSGLDPDLGQLPQSTLAPEDFSRLTTTGTARLSLPAAPSIIDNEELIRWLQTALMLLQTATNSPDFYPKAAQAVVDLAGMDSGRVLLLQGSHWRQEACALGPGQVATHDAHWQPSQRIMDRVKAERKTFWELPRLGTMGSVMGVQAVVAAPILDEKGEVIGVLYGDRHQAGRPITHVEAMLIELLACGVASRLARLKEEQAALRFEQFFTRELTRHLAANPEMLKGKIADVSLLFCDIRGFSKHSHHLQPDTVVAWISDVMAELSDCVIEHQGVLVDYIGDELIAMWGAPEEQPDHARRAVRAALVMLDRLPQLNRRWQTTLGEPMNFGIGINSGRAHVGNIGSPRKFKYGPLGDAVNLASRVQGATKHLKTRLLITRHTHALLDDALQARTRRLCTVRVVNIPTPVDLYELAAPDQQPWPDWKEKYEQALEEFERMNFRQAARVVQPLITEQVNDPPSIALLSRAVQGLANGPDPGHFVLELPK